MLKFRSGLEERVAEQLESKNIPFLYEAQKFKYVLESRYTPDFILRNGVVLEIKGFFKPSERRKHVALKEQHPDLDLRFVFQRNNTLTRNSKTRYSDWCDKHGFKWCIYPYIPDDWLS